MITVEGIPLPAWSPVPERLSGASNAGLWESASSRSRQSLHAPWARQSTRRVRANGWCRAQAHTRKKRRVSTRLDDGPHRLEGWPVRIDRSTGHVARSGAAGRRRQSRRNAVLLPWVRSPEQPRCRSNRNLYEVAHTPLKEYSARPLRCFMHAKPRFSPKAAQRGQPEVLRDAFCAFSDARKLTHHTRRICAFGDCAANNLQTTVMQATEGRHVSL